MTDLEFETVKAQSVADTLLKTKHWLRDNQFWFAGQTIPGLMKDLAEYRHRLMFEERPEGSEWARKIISKNADGYAVPLIALRHAQIALKNLEAMSPVNRKTHVPLLIEYDEGGAW